MTTTQQRVRSNKWALKSLIALAAVLAIWPAFAGSGNGQIPKIAIVVNAKVGLKNVTKAELSRLFMSLSDKAGGKKLKPLNLGNRKLTVGFLNALSGLSPEKIEHHFVQLELRDEGKWPSTVKSPKALVKLLARSKRAIGWMPLSNWEKLPEKQRTVLQLVAIDGKLPTEGGYPVGK